MYYLFVGAACFCLGNIFQILIRGKDNQDNSDYAALEKRVEELERQGLPLLERLGKPIG